jgi:DNA-binding response OmpR family regulator
VTADSGRVALEQALAEPPDAAVLDGVMPEMEGHEVCAAMRADSRTASVPVILLTAKAADADEREATEAGVDEFVVKPFRIDELDEKLRSLLSARSLRRGPDESHSPAR